MTRPYTNPYGVTLGACRLLRLLRAPFGCGWAPGEPPDTVAAGADEESDYELRTLANVGQGESRFRQKRAVSVTYVDSRGREFEGSQPT